MKPFSSGQAVDQDSKVPLGQGRLEQGLQATSAHHGSALIACGGVCCLFAGLQALVFSR